MKFLLLIFLAGCAGMPETPDGPQCSPVFEYTQDLKFISVENSYCLCRAYRFSLDYVGPVKDIEPWKEPIESCNRLIGWTPEEYVKKASYWENVRSYIKERANGNSTKFYRNSTR
jgi:hypothetical protein